MSKPLDRIITEEINKQVSNLNLNSPKDVTNVLKELFSLSTDRLMSNIGSVETDSKNQIAGENWDWLLDVINQSIEENPEEWIKSIKNVKLKILTFKYFSRQDLVSVDGLESFLRTNIKPYFTALQNYSDMNDFRTKFFILPTNILYSMVRYLFSLSDAFKQKIVVNNNDLKERITKFIELRMEMAEKITKISKGYQTVLDFSLLKELYDNGVLAEDNYVNRGINEFVMKLLNHKEAIDKLNDTFSSATLKDMKYQVETTAAYVAHTTAIKQETGQEYFTSKGQQIGKRFDNELDMVKDGNFEGYVVDGKSRLKEPNNRVTPPMEPMTAEGGGAIDSEGGSGGGSGFGGASSGGDFGGEFGNADFGGDFAPEGSEGEIPGVDDTADNEIGTEDDGTPMPDDEQGLPEDFGTVEDNTDTGNTASTEEPDDEKK